MMMPQPPLPLHPSAAATYIERQTERNGWIGKQAGRYVGLLSYAAGKHALTAHLRTLCFELHCTKGK